MNIFPNHINQSYFNQKLNLNLIQENDQDRILNDMRKEIFDKFEEIIRNSDSTIDNIIEIRIVDKLLLLANKAKKFVDFLKDIDDRFDNVYLICYGCEYCPGKYHLSIPSYSPECHDARFIIIQLNGKLPNFIN